MAGKISKKWGGVVEEAISDADTFHVEFPPTWTNSDKAVFLAAAFSVDLDCFEN